MSMMQNQNLLIQGDTALEESVAWESKNRD